MSSYPQMHKGERQGAAFSRSPTGVFDFASNPTPGVIVYKRYELNDIDDEIRWFNFDKEHIDHRYIEDSFVERLGVLRYMKFTPQKHYIYADNRVAEAFPDPAFWKMQIHTKPAMHLEQEFDGDSFLGYPFTGYGWDNYIDGDTGYPGQDPDVNVLVGEFCNYGNTVLSPYYDSYVQAEYAPVDDPATPDPHPPAEADAQKYRAEASGFVSGFGVTGEILDRSAIPSFNEWNSNVSGVTPIAPFQGEFYHTSKPLACEYDPKNQVVYVSFWTNEPPYPDPPGSIGAIVYHFGKLQIPDETHPTFWGYEEISNDRVVSIDFRPDMGGVFGLRIDDPDRTVFYSDGSTVSVVKSVPNNVQSIRWSDKIKKLFYPKTEFEESVQKNRIYTCDADGTNEEIWMEFERAAETIYSLECLD